jgi:CheY-like chemotaxis protein
LKRLLLDVAVVEFAESVEEVEELVRRGQVDMVLVDRAEDQPGDSQVISRLLSVPGARVITVSLATGDMQIYQHKQIGGASVDDLVAAVLA